MKILFCTDGSQTSFNALENISGWIRKATVDVICVIDWNILPSEISITDRNFSNTCANVADTIIDYAQEKISELGLTSGLRLKNCGSVIESILEQSEKQEYDLILMGSHGKKGLQKWLGSVSQEIINSSKNSVYISKDKNSKSKVLFTTDGTECSSEVIKNVLDNISLTDKEIHICIVNEDPNLLFLEGTLDTNWLLDIQKQQEEYSANTINNLKEIIEKTGVYVKKTEILTGIPAQEIINYAKKNDIDIIILGSRNKTKLDRFLTGSVSKRVLENTTSDVWLVRCKS